MQNNTKIKFDTYGVGIFGAFTCIKQILNNKTIIITLLLFNQSH